MYPVLLKIGDFTIPSYYTLIAMGFLLAMYLGWRESKRQGVNPDDWLDLSLYVLIAGMIGARILHVFADGFFMDYVHLCTDPLQVDVPSFIHVKCDTDAACVAADAGALCHPETGRCHPARDCFAALKFWHGGLAFLGGFVGAATYAMWFIRRREMPTEKVYGIAGFAVPLALAFGRAGCLLSGCCFGARTDGPLGVHFKGYVTKVGPDTTCPPRYDLVHTEGGNTVCAFGRPAFMEHVKHDELAMGADHSLGVHPTQAYEAGFALCIFLYLFFWRRTRARFASQVFWEFCVIYGVGRFVIEFFRADARGLWFGGVISTSQIIGLPLVAVGVWRLLAGFKRARMNGDGPDGDGPDADARGPAPDAA